MVFIHELQGACGDPGTSCPVLGVPRGSEQRQENCNGIGVEGGLDEMTHEGLSLRVECQPLTLSVETYAHFLFMIILNYWGKERYQRPIFQAPVS